MDLKDLKRWNGEKDDKKSTPYNSHYAGLRKSLDRAIFLYIAFEKFTKCVKISFLCRTAQIPVFHDSSFAFESYLKISYDQCQAKNPGRVSLLSLPLGRTSIIAVKRRSSSCGWSGGTRS